MLKRSLLLWIFSVAVHATTLTGTLASPYGGTATGILTLALSSPATVSPTCSGSLPGQPYQMTVSGGALQSPPVVVGNDCLVPANTYYKAVFKNASNGKLFTGQWNVRGATFDVGTVVVGQTGVLNGMSGADQFVTQAPGTNLYVNSLNVQNCTGCGGGGSVDPCTPTIASTPSGLHCITVTLTASQVLNNGSTPVLVVPAPGAGLVLFPVAYRYKAAYGTHPYHALLGNTYAGNALWWQNSSNAFGYACGPFSFASSLSPMTDQAFYFSSCGTSATTTFGVDPVNYTNQPLVVQGFPADSFDVGPVLSVAVGNSGGTGYMVGDMISLAINDGGTDCQFTVASAPGGVVSALTNSTPGTTCPPGNNQVTAGGTGSGLTVNLTVQPGDGTAVFTVWFLVASA